MLPNNQSWGRLKWGGHDGQTQLLRIYVTDLSGAVTTIATPIECALTLACRVMLDYENAPNKEYDGEQVFRQAIGRSPKVFEY